MLWSCFNISNYITKLFIWWFQEQQRHHCPPRWLQKQVGVNGVAFALLQTRVWKFAMIRSWIWWNGWWNRIIMFSTNSCLQSKTVNIHCDLGFIHIKSHLQKIMPFVITTYIECCIKIFINIINIALPATFYLLLHNPDLFISFRFFVWTDV